MRKGRGVEELIKIMSRLRSKKGCPWDRKQTHKSLTPYLIEEAHELAEAIRDGNTGEMKEELGDVLLQVVFHAQIASERGGFDLDEVARGVCEKLIERHPHVFRGKKGIKTPAHVRAMWEKNKKEKKKRDSVIDGVPEAMPALLRARRLVSKAGSAGFKWGKVKAVEAKIAEELKEVKAELGRESKKRLSDEIGDLLFVTAVLAYYTGINPEEALQSSNDKFVKRFKAVEKGLVRGMKEEDMLALWKEAKKNEKQF